MLFKEVEDWLNNNLKNVKEFEKQIEQIAILQF